MKNKNVIQKAKKILLKPKEFFNETKKEKGIKNSLKYILLLLLITQIFVVLYYFREELPRFGIELTTGNFIIIYVFITIFMIILSIVRSALTNFFIRFFSDIGKFEDTYKALTYGLTPDYIGTPFFIVTIVLLAINKSLNSSWILIAIIICAIVAGSATIYTIYLRTYGVAKLHKISLWRAYLSAYILPITLILFLELIILLLFGSFILLK